MSVKTYNNVYVCFDLLQLSVWNFHRLGHGEFLGEVIVPLGSYHFREDGDNPSWYPLSERVSQRYIIM